MFNNMKEYISQDIASLKHPLPVFIATLLFISPLLYVGILQDPSTLPRYAFLAVFVGVSLLLYCYQLFNKNVKVFYTPVIFLVFTYLALAGFSSLWAVEPGNNLIYIVQLISLIFLFFIVVQITSFETIRLFLYVSLFAAGLSALIGILQNLGYNFFELKGPRMGGAFGYKNHAALYLDLIIPVGFILILSSNNKILKLLSSVAFSICVIYIIMSHTRGSHVALYAVVFLFAVLLCVFSDIRGYILKFIVRDKIPLLVILVSILAVSFTPGKTDEVLNRPAYSGDKIDTSTRDRLTAYKNAFELIKEKPLLGSGYGTFWKAFRPFNNHPSIMLRSDENIVMYRLHSDPLQILVELGVVGVLLFLGIFFWTFIISIKLLRIDITIIEKLFVSAMLLSLSASLVHSLVDFPFLKPSSAIQIWLYVGLLNGLYAKNNNKFVTISSVTIKILSIFISIIFLIGSFMYYRAFLYGSYYLNLAEESYKQRYCQKSINYIEKSIRVFRHDFFTHKMRVNFHIACTKNNSILYKVLNEELRWDDTNTMALKWRGYLYLNAGKLNLANEDFNRLSYLLPHRPSGYIGRAYVLLELGERYKAEQMLVKLLDEHPDNKEIKKAIKKIRVDTPRISQ